MGCSDFHCLICGLPSYDVIDGLEWLENCVILTPSNQVIINCFETACNFAFESQNYPGCTFYDNNLFIHNHCYVYVYKKYNIKLKYSHFNTKKYSNDNYNINPGDDIVHEYYDQTFNIEQLIEDKNEYLLLSPYSEDQNSKNYKKNIKRINETIEAYAFINTTEKPNIKNCFIEEKEYRIGKDKKLWQNINNEWIKCSSDLVKIEIEIDFNKLFKKKYSYIGQSSKKTIFMKEIIEENTGKYKFYLIGDKNLLKNIAKKNKYVCNFTPFSI